VHLKGADSMAVSGLRNSPLVLHGTYFQRGSFFTSLSEQLLADCYYYCKLVNGLVWFEAEMGIW